MSERSWDPEENGKPKEYMAGFQSRYFGERIPLFHDEESFLQLLIKDDRMKIYKWEWSQKTNTAIQIYQRFLINIHQNPIQPCH